MKKMIYQSERTYDIIAHGVYKDFPYWVVSMGTHPCSYIDVTAIKDSLDADLVICHGGVTYDEDNLRCVWDEAFDDFKAGAKRFIGWDFAHSDDYFAYSDSSMLCWTVNAHKWTTEELVNEVKDVIDFISSLE